MSIHVKFIILQFQESFIENEDEAMEIVESLDLPISAAKEGQGTIDEVDPIASEPDCSIGNSHRR